MSRSPKARSDPSGSPGTEPYPFARVYDGETFLRSHRMQPGKLVFGRDSREADIVLDARYVSRRHFQLEYEGGQALFVQDLGSSNGLLVNGKRTTRAALGHGDEIRIGNFRVVVSHRAFTKSNVIPFPDLKTAPEAVVAETPVRVLPEETQAGRRRFPAANFLLPVLAIAAAAGLAWQLHRWTGTLRLPEPGMPPIVRSAPKVNEEPLRPPEVRAAPPAAEVRAAVPAPRRKPPQEVSGGDVVARLDRSLGDAVSEDFREVGKMKKSPAEGTNGTRTALKDVGGVGLDVLDVEIELPRAAAAEPGGRAPSPSYDPGKYREMLRGKIRGVDRCYYEHEKRGGSGSVAVTFSIGANGRVTSSRISSATLANPELHACILERIRVLNVDRPPYDGFTVTYAFRFGVKKMTF